jgi:glycosyltransferase involved in cell wall biosynthesis
MPTAILEAMALGIPVVATDVGAVRELVEDGITGFVVPPGAPERIAEAALRLLVDPELRARLGDAGRDRSTVQFPLDRLAALHADAYRRALSHRASP